MMYPFFTPAILIGLPIALGLAALLFGGALINLADRMAALHKDDEV
jgi:hypothetical protein